MRFLADENVSRLVVEQLRAAGFDVISIGATRSGASDKDVLGSADSDDRILITEDRDFGELVAAVAGNASKQPTRIKSEQGFFRIVL